MTTTRWTVMVTAVIASCASGHADTLNVPGGYGSIQSAIDAADPGDEVVVAPGTYFERIDFLGKAITVRSTEPTDPAVVLATIIDGESSGTVVECLSGEGPDSVLAGFVVTHGSFPIGGGMRIDASDPTVMHCVFVDNAAELGGGISSASSSEPTIIACTVRDNVAGDSPGGGGGLANLSGSRPFVSDTLVCGNLPDQVFGQYHDEGGNQILDECPANCPADLDGDGTVAVGDLLILLGGWGTAVGDVDGDGSTDVADLLALLGAWGTCG